MKKRYIALTMFIISSLTRAEDVTENTAEKTRAGLTSTDKSTFFYAQSLSASTVASGATISAAGYYLLSGAATTAGSGAAITISASNVTLDLDANSIAFGSAGTIAISISNSVKNVTIKNGTISGAFTTGGILIGNTTSNILLENIKIDGPDGYGVYALGTTGTGAIRGLTLKDVTVSKCTKTSAALYPIDITFAQGVALENIDSIGSDTTTSGAISGIRIQNSNSVTGTNIVSCNHSGVDATIGLQLVSCENLILKEVNVSNNDSDTAASSSGLVLTNCKNGLIKNLAADNISNTLNNVLIANSNNITIENASASNSTGAAMTSISMTAALSVLLRNVTVTNNASTAAAAYIGIGAAGTCKNITLENVAVQANSVASGANITGIDLAATNGVEIQNCAVTQNEITAGTTTHEAKGLNVANNVKDLKITNSQFNANTAATGSTTATGGLVAGVYIDGVAGCEIYNSQANRNNGTGRAYGFYITNTNGLVMSGCTANRNAAAIKDASSMNTASQEGGMTAATNADGIEALPSAGLYLLVSNYAEVTDCKFINNQSGNFALGGGAGAAPSIATSCSAHGVANQGTNGTTRNLGNTFKGCIFQGNNTQLANSQPVESMMMTTGYLGTAPNQYHQIREAFAAGATEQFTSGSCYKDCSFNANGNSCNFAVGFGLCVFTGCNTLYVNNCTASTNGWYGFYDSTATNHVTAFTSCVSSMNGVGNTPAIAAVATADTRNYGINGATPYKSVTIADFSQISPTGSSYINLSVTPAA